MNFICAKCGKKAPVSTRRPKCDCGGLWELDYHPPTFSEEQIDRQEWSLFRYRKFMALENDCWKDISLREGMTPVIPPEEKPQRIT